MSLRSIILFGALATSAELWGLDPARGLDHFSYQTWQTGNGLPQNTVQTILQTRSGYIWLGTEGGLVRFDGQQFVAFDSRNTACRNSNNVRALVEDRAGTLWIATAEGLCAWNEGHERSFTTTNGLPDNSVLALQKDHRGTVWAVTPNGVVEIVTGAGERAITFRNHILAENAPRLTGPLVFSPADTAYIGTERGLDALQRGQFTDVDGMNSALVSGPVTALLADTSKLWVGTSKGLHSLALYASKTARSERVPGCEQGSISTLLRDRQGTVWVGDANGLRRIENGGCGAQRALTGETIIALMEDAEGDLWAGSETQGVTVARDQKFSMYTTRNGVASDAVRCVFQDHEGGIWIGTNNGLTRVKGGVFTTWTTREGLSSNVILSLGENADGNLLAGTPDGLNRIQGHAVSVITSADGLADDFIRSIFRDRDGTLWIGTRRGLSHAEGGRFRTYTQADGLGSDLVGAMLRDRKGDLWVGTLAGLSKYSGGKFKNYGTSAGLSSEVITALNEDSRGDLWLGTQNNGLNVRTGQRFVPLSRIEALPKVIYGIAEDNYGNLWLATNSGIARVNRGELIAAARSGAKQVSVSWYGTSDGLLISECSSGGHPDVWKAVNGTIWFSTVKGLAMLDPNAARLNRVPPPLLLESVQLDDRSFAPRDLDKIPPGHSRIAFNYAGLSFAAPQSVQYRYRLEPFDNSWIDAGTRRTAYYTNIPPGNYTFKVIARNNDGFWTPVPASFKFQLDPAFYQTYWFDALVVLSLCLAGLSIYRWRVKEVEARFLAVSEERNRIAREIHDTLAQGFVGVSMQLEIVSRLLGASAGAAREHLDQARLQVRESIAEARRSIWQLRSQSAESEDLASRLSKAAAQCVGTRPVKVTVEVHGTNRRLEAKTEDELLRIAQEALTNALKHGDPHSIRIELTFEAKKLRLSITDDGTGFEPADASLSANGHYGLRGMRERAEQIRANLVVESEAGKGTSIVVEARLN
jgi:ligand-binding sensor domain-containing protein/two-component sensor histidine kinase